MFFSPWDVARPNPQDTRPERKSQVKSYMAWDKNRANASVRARVKAHESKKAAEAAAAAHLHLTIACFSPPFCAILAPKREFSLS
jgi:hypothetical protein